MVLLLCRRSWCCAAAAANYRSCFRFVCVFSVVLSFCCHVAYESPFRGFGFLGVGAVQKHQSESCSSLQVIQVPDYFSEVGDLLQWILWFYPLITLCLRHRSFKLASIRIPPQNTAITNRVFSQLLPKGPASSNEASNTCILPGTLSATAAITALEPTSFAPP